MNTPARKNTHKTSSAWQLLFPSFYDPWAWLGGLAVAIPFLFQFAIKLILIILAFKHPPPAWRPAFVTPAQI